MITTTRINEEFKDKEGLDWITALTSVQIRQLFEEEGSAESNAQI